MQPDVTLPRRTATSSRSPTVSSTWWPDVPARTAWLVPIDRPRPDRRPGTSALRLFTSESVTEGHPDKICDQISDSILDALIGQDPTSRVAVETLVTTGLVHVAG